MTDSSSPLRVMVVDDERTIADSLAMILIMQGYEAQAEYSAESAVESLSAFVPDVMIADVIMGTMNGLELALYMREHFPDCTVILFSGQAETAALLDGPEAQRFALQPYTKPVHPQVILELLAGEAARRGCAATQDKRQPSSDDQPTRTARVLPFQSRSRAG